MTKITVVFMSLFLLACSTYQSVLPPVSSSQKALILSGSVELAGEPVELPDAKEIWEVTPEMKEFIEFYAPSSMDNNYRLRMLARALGSGSLLGMEYDPSKTLIPKEAFRYQSANCLSFSMLVFAMAKSIGLDVEFNDVEIPPVWDLVDGERLYFYKHVNVKAKPNSGEILIVDINLDEFDASYPQRTISEHDVLVHFYNNIGVELMFAGNYSSSYNSFLKALKINKKAAHVWSNMGVLLRRSGNKELARDAFLVALNSGSFSYVAASNLHKLSVLEGEEALAARLESMLVSYKKRNPYYQLAEAKKFRIKGELAKAEVAINKAVKIRPDEHTFHFERSLIMLRLGRLEESMEEMRLAEQLSENISSKTAYSSKLNMLASHVSGQ